jgi:hypothetical protein
MFATIGKIKEGRVQQVVHVLLPLKHWVRVASKIRYGFNKMKNNTFLFTNLRKMYFSRKRKIQFV